MNGMYPSWRQRVLSALALLLLIAVGVRIVADLLEPLVPMLAVLLVLGAVFWLVIGRHRH